MEITGTLANLLLSYQYLFLFPAALLAGPLVTMLSGIFGKLGYINPFLAYLTIVSAEFLGDLFWYYMGYHYGESFVKRFGRYVGITDETIAQTKQVFQNYHNSILIISKLTNGFGLAIVILFTAGLSRVPFWKYAGLNLLGESIWAGALISVGYFFGQWYLTVDSVLGKVGIGAFLVILVLLFIGFGRYLRTHIR